MPDAQESPSDDLGIFCLVLSLLIAIPVTLLITFGFADPYSWQGFQSARWWWLRYPLVFATLMVFAFFQAIIAIRIEDADFAAQFEKATTGMNALLFATGLVAVTAGGSTVMNLYNASYGEGAVVKARRVNTFITPKSNRSLGSTEVRYEVLEGTLKGQTLSFSTSSTTELGTKADDGRPALLSIKTSWMGISVLGVYDQ